ncbi:uncharacterized protein Dwil_GK22411 [Drosophila willistoni]|uniref:RING-type E3 ubiquitin transferase n=2 Tax=Drosophila willistoni TaxID=7260 RepID=B4NG59_DROWI|nr:uncharacterized protein Dwil_GK22411 [Drosophila willistoni]
MLVDETEGSSSENSLDTVEEHELEITDNDAEDNEDNDSTDSTTVNMNSDSTNSGTDEGIPHLTRSQMNNQHLAPYICNVCKGYVRGAVITICGHLFCWTCLWPLLESRAYPNCPRCLRRLNLHEDIVPFHGEGPHAEATDANEVAQPGNVERPSGVYLNEYHPEWFAVNEFERLVLNALIESETERNLYDVLLKIPIYHPLIATCIKFLNGIQISLGLLMFILWGFFSLNERN